MTAATPDPAKPSDETLTALASIDLSGGEEAPVQAFGRIAGGILLMILGLAIGLGFLGAYLFGWLWEPIADWVELLEDILLIPAALGLGLLITGFELVRRGRKARAAEARQAADIISTLGASGALDDSPKPFAGSGETHL